MSNKELIDLNDIYNNIREKILNARTSILKQIDNTMVEVKWYVGKITSEILNSCESSYGKNIVETLSSKLTKEFGTGYSAVSIRRMKSFYETFPNWSTVSTELS